MPNNHKTLNRVFQALSDGTRRSVIQRLSDGPATVSELAEPFEMALPSFVQHLKVLENNGLIRTKKVGRVRTCEMVPETLLTAEQWIADRRQLLEGHLNALEQYLDDSNVLGNNGGGKTDENK